MRYTADQKQSVLSRYLDNKETVAQLSADTGIPRSTLYSWIKQRRKEDDTPKQITRKKFRHLLDKVERLEGIITILKTVHCTVHAPLQERLAACEQLYEQYSVHMLCDAMNVSRGTFYNHIKRNKRDNTWYAKRRKELREQIQLVYDESNQIFGSKKIVAILRNKGIKTSDRIVRELMQDMGLLSIRQGAKKMYEKENAEFRNHVNQQFNVKTPNQVWVSDVTQFRFNEKNYYICVIIDLFSRKVIAHRISKRNSTQLVKGTFKAAYDSRLPGLGLIFHSDRGSTYRADAFCRYLKWLSVTQSFSRAHIPYDNSVVESFFSSMKREELYRTKYRSEREFKEAVAAYMVFYNEKRPHAKLKYLTPNQREAEFSGSEGK